MRIGVCGHCDSDIYDTEGGFEAHHCSAGDDYKALNAEWQTKYDAMEREMNEALRLRNVAYRERDELAAALRKYGQHQFGCGRISAPMPPPRQWMTNIELEAWQKAQPCICGLEAMLTVCGCTIGSNND